MQHFRDLVVNGVSVVRIAEVRVAAMLVLYVVRC